MNKILTKNYRLPIQVKLTFEDGEVYNATRTKRMRLKADLIEFTKRKGVNIKHGWCKVWYNKKLNYYNEFEFTDLEDFENTLSQDTEMVFLKELFKDDTLDPKYMQKRKGRVMTPEQRKEASERMRKLRARLK